MNARRSLRLAALAFLVLWPWLPLPTSLLGNANTAGLYFLPAISLVMLTGWIGQVSLAQASFVGVGAYLTAMATRDWGIGFPMNLPAGALAAALAAALLGVVALRVRGLYLAVATLIFAWAADAYLFTADWMGGVGGSTTADVPPIGSPDQLPYIDFTDRRTFYYLVLATCALAAFAVLNLRDSKTGRMFLAVRGSEIAAASFGVDVVRAKLVAFALSGFIAGLAGSLLIVHQGAVVSDQFDLTDSLFYLSVAVVGGLGSVSGAAAAAVLFAALNELFFRVDALAGYLDVVSACLLAAVLLVYPGGLAALGRMLAHRAEPALRRASEVLGPLVARAASLARRWTNAAARALSKISPMDLDRFRSSGAGRIDQTAIPDVFADEPAPEAAEEPGPVVPAAAAAVPVSLDETGRRDTPPVLAAAGITVRFGGLTAVDDVSLEVRQGEIVGLIGPNGAGKTTTFNAISGLNHPTSGTVMLHGRDATDAPVHQRAAYGVARTFQVLQLFPQLDVFDNLLVGTHLHGRTGPLSSIVLTRRAIESELDATERVQEVIELLDLGDMARRRISGLPFGVLRMVELARAVVTGAPLIMLDEPASGLDNSETDRLSDLLRRIRGEFGVSLLVIEHDVRMVTALTDYLYVLDQGRLIARGTPAEIQRDEAVIAAYLGTASSAEVGA